MDDFVATLRSLWVVWLLLIFVAAIAWALWPGNRDRFRRDAQIPFKDDDQEPRP